MQADDLREKSAGIALPESKILPPTACMSFAIQRRSVLKNSAFGCVEFRFRHFYNLKILHPFIRIS
jgi:hypothetical protein